MANAAAETLVQATAPADNTPLAVPNGSGAHRVPFDVQLYYRGYRLLEQFQSLTTLAFTSLSLATLSDRRRYAIDRVYYDRERMYHTAKYNEQGLWDWERQVVEKHFAECKRVLVASAGGGREVIALRRMGVEAVGFECHPELVAFANILMERLGLAPDIRAAPRDECLDFGTSFSGAIVGWGGYTLIRSRRRRIAFLRQLRSHMNVGAPLLISFVTRSRSARRFAAAAAVANVLRHVLGGEHVETGDFLVPNYVHLFIHEEIVRELNESGFELTFFGIAPYGHAVACAR